MSLIAIIVVMGVLAVAAYINYKYAPDGLVKNIVYVVLAVIMLFFLADLAGLTQLGTTRV